MKMSNNALHYFKEHFDLSSNKNSLGNLLKEKINDLLVINKFKYLLFDKMKTKLGNLLNHDDMRKSAPNPSDNMRNSAPNPSAHSGGSKE